MLRGLLDRDGVPPAEMSGLMNAYAVQLPWSALQPRRRGPLATGELDRALRHAAAIKATVKLRVMAGVHAPGWAKQLAGGPIRMVNPTNGASGTVPLFWTKPFGRAYARLQRRLAARYDDRDVLREVVVSRCTVFYAEPFLRHSTSAGNRAALVAAGYTRKRDRACHRAQIAAHTVWHRTRSGLALNPGQFVTARRRPVVDDGFTAQMMAFCRGRLGQRCVLENQSIRSPISRLDRDPREPHYQRMYRAMNRQGPPLAFQTATPGRIGNCDKTLTWALDQQAAYVELPRDPYAAGCTREAMAHADARLGD